MKEIIYGKLVDSKNLFEKPLYENPEGWDEFFINFAEWLFNPMKSFKNHQATVKVHKFLYDYMFLTLYKVDELERSSKRLDWTLELEPFYGESFLYRTPFGNIEIKLAQ